MFIITVIAVVIRISTFGMLAWTFIGLGFWIATDHTNAKWVASVADFMLNINNTWNNKLSNSPETPY